VGRRLILILAAVSIGSAVLGYGASALTSRTTRADLPSSTDTASPTPLLLVLESGSQTPSPVLALLTVDANLTSSGQRRPQTPSPVPVLLTVDAILTSSAQDTPTPIPGNVTQTNLPVVNPSSDDLTTAVPTTMTPGVDTTPLVATPTFVPPAPSPTVTLAAIAAGLQIMAQGFSDTQQRVGFAFIVQNTSDRFVTDDTRYVVTAYGPGGKVVQTMTGDVGVVLPKQQPGVAGTLTVPGGGSVSRLNVSVAPARFRLPWTDAAVPLTTTSVTWRSSTASTTVSGTVANPYAIGFGEILVSAIAYDNTSAIIGGGSAMLTSLPPHAQSPIDVPVTTAGPPASVELYAAPRSLPAVH
jgi:hypothetical protein